LQTYATAILLLEADCVVSGSDAASSTAAVIITHLDNNFGFVQSAVHLQVHKNYQYTPCPKEGDDNF